MDFYTISEEYVNYLIKYDEHVVHNKEENRPYIGNVLIIDEKHYFVPLFSPKLQHKTYKENFTFFNVLSDSKEKLGIIKFSSMIPVPLSCLYKLNIQDKKYGYRRLIQEQYSYVNVTKNRERIKEKARKLYDIVTSNKTDVKTRFYKKISCDFKSLEENVMNI